MKILIKLMKMLEVTPGTTMTTTAVTSMTMPIVKMMVMTVTLSARRRGMHAENMARAAQGAQDGNESFPESLLVHWPGPAARNSGLVCVESVRRCVCNRWYSKRCAANGTEQGAVARRR